MDLGGGEVAADADADALWGDGHAVDLFLDSSGWSLMRSSWCGAAGAVRCGGPVGLCAVGVVGSSLCRPVGGPVPEPAGPRVRHPAGPDWSDPNPPNLSDRPRITIKTQYVVVSPPPRYEIVGLLQQRSYTPVNEFFRQFPARGGRMKFLLGARSRRIANDCWPRADDAGRGARPDPATGLTTVHVWPPVLPSRPSPSPSTPGPPGSGPWWWTSGPGWSTWPTAS